MNQQQIQCLECHTWNSGDQTFCDKCGARLFPFAGEWWKEQNMYPVRLNPFKPYLIGGISIVLICLLGLYLSGAMIAIGFAGIFFNQFDRVPFLAGILIGIIMLVFGVFLFWFNIRKFCKYGLIWLLPNYMRKKRKELLDDDYIESCKNRKEHYVFIARGNGSSHKFGLFDVQKIKVCVPMKYDELKWTEKGKLLKGVFNGYPVIIDVNGNNYQ